MPETIETDRGATHAQAASFTLAGYRERLERTAGLYPMVGYDILGDEDLASRSFCLLRHDIDISPERALATARIEADLGVSATYTVLFTGRFYSPFEREVRETLKEIAGLGHTIGLHFDAVWHGIEEEGLLADAIEWEASILRRLLGVDVTMFAFHDTTPFTLDCKARSYAGLWNAYAGALRDNCTYVSDSNGYWRFHGWDEVLDQSPERLHLLTHSEWWVEEESSPGERVCTYIEDRSRFQWHAYSENLSVNGRTNKRDLDDSFDHLRSAWGQRGAEIERLWLSGSRSEALMSLQVELERRGADGSTLLRERVLDAAVRNDSADMRRLFVRMTSAIPAPEGASGR